MAKKKDRVFTAEFFRRAGKRGGKLGGLKAAANMTSEERAERARKAVAARAWRTPLTEEEKAQRQAAKKPVGRPRLTDEEKARRAAAKPVVKRGRPRKVV